MKLENIISKYGITLEIHTLPESILGYYFHDAEDTIILINKSVLPDSRLYRCVLAEEIGHHMTSIEDLTPRKYMCYRDRLVIDKRELAALRWSTGFLVPTSDLLNDIKNDSSLNISKLAEDFMVTEELVKQKFEFMSKKNGIWDIDSKRSLYLYNLPSVYILEKILPF